MFRHELTIKAALLLGFGLTVGVWMFAWYDVSRRMGSVERRAEVINTRYTHAQELLSTVRARILLGSVFVRDALLDPGTRSAAEHHAQLDAIYREADAALQQYVPVLDSAAERERVDGLRREITAFRDAMLRVLASDSSRWRTDAAAILRTEVVPKRELVIRLSEQVQALNRSAFVQEQQGIARLFGRMQRRVWEMLGISLVASFGIALLATLYATRLERRIREQTAKEMQHARELQQLSAKLITAQEEERRTIARELHDEIGQVLTTINVELSIAQRTIEAAGGGAHVLDEVRTITDSAVQTVRDLSHLLHPSLLDDLGLAEATEWYLRGFGERHGLRVDLLHEGMDARLAPDLEASAYRIVQEALTNVAKHARATTCRVYLQRLPGTVLITIEDDGIGFTPVAGGRSQGLGLVGIRERTNLLHGTLRLESAPGRGTRVTVELPAVSASAPADAGASAIGPFSAME